jgi:hypothetical protein
MARHQFQPRYRGIAIGSAVVGAAVAGISALAGFVMLPLASGVLGVAAGAAYLASPTWRLAVTVDDDGREVGSPKRIRFKLAWGDVQKVVASPTTKSCFVDGGSPSTSLLVPGVGAPAPYDLADRAALFDAILAPVPEDKVQIVETLEQAKAEAAAEARRKP